MNGLIRLLRHVIAIAALPFVMAVAVPWWLAERNESALSSNVAALVAGTVLLLIGLALFVSSLRRFDTDGAGTLAPWDPPRHLVVNGPYRFVRNPMISGVLFVICAESVLLMSVPHAQWALTFFVINCIYIPLLEEPMLRSRFGAEYDEYCANVPRLIPRLHAWIPAQPH